MGPIKSEKKGKAIELAENITKREDYPTFVESIWPLKIHQQPHERRIKTYTPEIMAAFFTGGWLATLELWDLVYFSFQDVGGSCDR